MASKVIKGLTVEIGGDTTKLGKALENVEKKTRDLSSELGEINRLLKMDPGNADLLAQKQKVLAEAVENTAKKLETLQDAEKQVQEQFKRGEVSEEQVRALQREITATTQKMEQYERAAKETAEAVESLGDKSKRSAEETADLKNKLSDVATAGFKGLVGACTAAVAGLTAAVESTREYRTEMGKLDAAFETAGHSATTATDTYKTLQGVIGETDQAVEASQQIALLARSEQDAAQWADLAAGVVGRFGDALQPEVFYESANETLKLNEATGSYVQLLEGCGYSVEKFNEGLAACATAEEKQAYMLQITDELLGSAADKYRENNAEIIAANEANEAWTASMAEVGAAAEPLLTEVKSMGAALLSDLVPAIQFLLDNLPAIGVAMAGITAAVVAFKIAAIAATAASKGMTLAQYAMAAAQKVLNVVMSANPIGLIILAITGLVTAFMLLWKNCEGFRNFWINLWENIKTGASAAINAVVTFFQQLPERVGTWLTNMISRVTTWATNLAAKAKEAGSKFLQGVVSFFKNLPYNLGYWLGAALGTIARWAVDTYNKAKEMGKNFLQAVVSFFKQLPQNVATWTTNTIQKISTWSKNMATKAKETGKNFLQAVVSFFKNLPSNVATWLTNTIAKVTAWATNLAAKGKAAATSLVSAVTNGIKSLPQKVADVGKNLVTGLWNGVQNKFEWLKSKLKSFASGVLDGIKKFFGVHSPSRETAWIGEMLDEGLGEGITDAADTPIRAMQRVSGGVLDAASGMGGVGFERSLASRAYSSAPAASAAGGNSALLAKLDGIYERLGRLQIVLDTGTLVGETLDKIDAGMAHKQLLAARGV